MKQIKIGKEFLIIGLEPDVIKNLDNIQTELHLLFERLIGIIPLTNIPIDCFLKSITLDTWDIIFKYRFSGKEYELKYNYFNDSLYSQGLIKGGK